MRGRAGRRWFGWQACLGVDRKFLLRKAGQDFRRWRRRQVLWGRLGSQRTRQGENRLVLRPLLRRRPLVRRTRGTPLCCAPRRRMLCRVVLMVLFPRGLLLERPWVWRPVLPGVLWIVGVLPLVGLGYVGVVGPLVDLGSCPRGLCVQLTRRTRHCPDAIARGAKPRGTRGSARH